MNEFHRLVVPCKMSEHIELRSVNINNIKQSDIEYHEIKNDQLLETEFSPGTSTVKLPKAYDFFTQYDLKSQKDEKKKKKNRKKDQSLIDIINSELASVEPVRPNVIIRIDHSKENRSYLQSTPRLLLGRTRVLRGDTELGWRHKSIDLKPVFPQVLENTMVKENTIHVQYVEPVMFTDLLTEYQKSDVKKSPKFLDISIKDIIFNHHYDFSLEKLLCIKLIDCYRDYCGIKKEITDTLRNIDIYRKTRDNLKQELLNISSNKKENLRYDQTILKYTGMFLNFKQNYYQLLNNKNELQHTLFSLWADIEMLRDKFGFTDTEYYLEASTNSLDTGTFEKEWTQVFETEFSDMLDKLEYEYVSKYLEYKDLKQNYAAGDMRRKKITKPKLQIDQDKLKEEVEVITNKIVTKDTTDIILKEDKKALKRYNEIPISTYSYNFKMYIDNVFVCESETITSHLKLNQVDFIDTLSIEILPNNKTLVIFLCEDNIRVASIIIDLYEVRVNSSKANFSKESFKYNSTVEPTAQKIGSGFELKEIVAKSKVRLRTGHMFKGKLCTNAEVNLKIGWSDIYNENECVELLNESISLGKQLKRLMHGIDKPNVGILRNIIENIYDIKIDKDQTFMDALQDACESTIHDDSLFNIEENSAEFVRLKLLQLRNSGGFDDVDDKKIPLFASQISTEQLNCLQKSEKNELDLQYLDDNSDIDPIDKQRFMNSKYVLKLNAKLQKRLNEHLLKKTYKDVVNDFKNLSIRGIFSNQTNFDLETTSRIAKRQMLAQCLPKEQEISILVSRAFNLLDRSTAIIAEEVEDDDSIAGFKVRPLRPFVKVNYRDVYAQTPTAIGCHPTWNCALKINTKLSPLSSLHVNVYDEYKVDVAEAYSEEEHSLSRAVHYRYYNKWLGTVQIPLFSVLSLGSLRGTFKITSPPLIFGYDTLESQESKSFNPEVVQLLKKQASFLTLQISSNLFHLGGFEGYTQPVPNSEDDLIVKHLNTFVTDYLNEFPSRNISLTYIDSFGKNKCVKEFLQPIQLPDSDWLPKNPKRTESAVSKSSGLSKSSSSKSSRRKLSIATNGEDKESENSAVENVWKGAESGVDQRAKLMDAAVRYVALIPTYEITEAHVVTLRGTELLKVLYGSPLDHTILLACYFLHLGIRCWVVTGLALPRGLSSYVLVKYDQRHRVVMFDDSQKISGFWTRGESKQFKWFVYDAVSGERFELRDAGCPLKTVSHVFDAENIWVNIQSSQECETVSFDFSKSTDWQPVFDDPVMMIKSPPVCAGGLYSAPPDVERLRAALEGKIKAKVQKWRSHMKTLWNRHCSSLLREMLPHWEYWAFHPTGPRPAPGQRLKQMMVTYKMFGFPLNLPYTSPRGVTASVKAAGAHLADAPGVEFALAVEVYAYPNSVLSVWVFLASISRI